MSWTAADHLYMARALRLARRGLYSAAPNPRVGCVIVKNGEVIGEGWHRRAGDAHAEIQALRALSAGADGASCYVTLEPCVHQGLTPPCAPALIDAGVKRVIAATVDPNPLVAGGGLRQLEAAGVATAVGLMGAEARALNAGFEQRMRRGRPWLRCKLAMSLDGRTALADGKSRWISGAASRMDVQMLRARSSAILTGANTVLADDPRMDLRPRTWEKNTDAMEPPTRQPLRAVIDPDLVIPPNARILRPPGEAVVFTANRASEKWRKAAPSGVELVPVDAQRGAAFFEYALAWLAAEKQVNEALLESGATLAGAMLQAGLLDELIVYMAPVLLGPDARGLMQLKKLEMMSERIELNYTDVRSVGPDLRITATINNKPG